MVLNNIATGDESRDVSPTMDSSSVTATKKFPSASSPSASNPVRLHSRIASHRPTPALSVVQETVLKVEAGKEESDLEVVVVGANESSALTQNAGPTWDADDEDSLDSEKIGLFNSNGEREDVKECNYDVNPSLLFQGLQAHEWEWVLNLFRTKKETSYFAEYTAKFFDSIKSATGGGKNNDDDEDEKNDRRIDEQVKTWVVRRNQPTGDIRWRMLPLHAALMHRAPHSVISLLLTKYPTAAQCRDDRGMLPLHLAFRHDHENDVLVDLLEVYPHATEVRDLKGRVPLECCPQPTTSTASGEAAAQQLARSRLMAKRNAVLRTYVSHAISTERSYTLQDSAVTLDEREKALWTEYGNATEVLKSQHQAKIQSKDEEIRRLREGEKELLDKVKELSAALEKVTSKKGVRSISPFGKTSSKQGSIGTSSSGLYVGSSGIGSSASRATPAPVASADSSVEVESSSRCTVGGSAAAIVGGVVAVGAVATGNNNEATKEAGKSGEGEDGALLFPTPDVERNLQPAQGEEDEVLACAVPIKEEDDYDETNNNKKGKSKRSVFSFLKKNKSSSKKKNQGTKIAEMRSTDDGNDAAGGDNTIDDDEAASLKQIKSATSSEKRPIVTGAEQSLMAVQHHPPNDVESLDELKVSHDANETMTTVDAEDSNSDQDEEEEPPSDDDAVGGGHVDADGVGDDNSEYHVQLIPAVDFASVWW